MIYFKYVYSMYKGMIFQISNIFERITEDNQPRITEDNQPRDIEHGS